MKKMIYVVDIEANGLDPTKIHVIAVKHFRGTHYQYFLDMNQFAKWVENTEVHKWVFHNGLNYDVPVINRLIKENLIEESKVIDTAVVSRLKDYTKFNTHSLKELGEYLGVYKGDYNGGWDELNQDMIDYCMQDVLVTEAILEDQWDFLSDPKNRLALETEHGIASVCHQMQTDGFHFNRSKAEELLEEISEECSQLEDSFQKSFPPVLKEVKRLSHRVRKDNTFVKALQDNMDKYPKWEFSDDKSEVVFYDYIEFNPGSPKDRIDVLWNAGWKPTDKTEGHKKHVRSKLRW